MSTDIRDAVREAAEIIRSADAILITAGAGLGVDSGLPDFRGRHGFWKAYPPIAKLGISFEEMANPRWFETNPGLAWAFYGHRMNLYRKTVPHEGFAMLMRWADAKVGGYFVFTSNVDGQFQKAGFNGERVEECHGSIHHLQCAAPCARHIWSADGITLEIDEEKFEAAEPLPLCGSCGNIARPNILMFGDWSWIPDRSAGQEHRKRQWMDELQRNGWTPAVIEIGAGISVPTVRYMSESVARETGGKLIRINPRDYSVPGGGVSIPMGAKEGTAAISGLLE